MKAQKGVLAEKPPGRSNSNWGRKEPVIAKAAMGVFSRKGFHETTMQDVADEAGVGKATLYYYAASKEDLFCMVAQQVADALDDIVGEVDGAELQPDEAIRTIVRRHLELFQCHRPLIEALVSESGSMHRRFVDTAQGAIGRLVKAAAAALERGKRSGDVRPDLDCTLCARMLVGMDVFYSVQSIYADRNGGFLDDEVDGAAHAICEVFLRGMLARPEGGRP